MALFLFSRAILAGEPIQVFNHGQMIRNFTYIDDIIESMMRLLKNQRCGPSIDTANPDPATSWAPSGVQHWQLQPTPLMHYIEALEQALGVMAVKQMKPMQLGDVPITAADTSELEDWVSFKPNTSVKEGVAKFVAWYREFYRV